MRNISPETGGMFLREYFYKKRRTTIQIVLPKKLFLISDLLFLISQNVSFCFQTDPSIPEDFCAV